jgi:tetratricopeptide (TPR) repeat protein
MGTLVPALGFINVYPMRYSFVADHFQYLAGVGLIALCAAGLDRMPRIVSATVAVVLGVLTWQQAGIYRNPETLWRDTLAKNPGCWLALNNLGVILEDDGKIDEAMSHYRKAVQLNPNFFEALNNIGGVLAAHGRLDEAIGNYRKAIQINPGCFDALNNLGRVLAAQGRLDEAIENYRRAIQINPNSFIAHDNLGQALSARGRFDEAIESYGKAIQIDPNHAETHFNLGIALDQLGHTREAIAQYREALKLNPGLAGAMNNLAWVLAASSDDKLRNGAEAVRLAEYACELAHDREPLFMRTLAAAYAECGRFSDAMATAGKAEQLATTNGLKDWAEKNRQLLELYRAGKPYHEPRPASPKNSTTNSAASATVSSSFPKTPSSRMER